MIRALFLAAATVVSPTVLAAHQLIVFASSDCEAVTVEAKFSNGNAAQQADVRILNGANELIKTLALENDGTATVMLSDVDHAEGLVIEVDTGSHNNYWLLTPEDIARNCRS